MIDDLLGCLPVLLFHCQGISKIIDSFDAFFIVELLLHQGIPHLNRDLIILALHTNILSHFLGLNADRHW